MRRIVFFCFLGLSNFSCDQEELELPVIPKLTRERTETHVYDFTDPNQDTLSAREKERSDRVYLVELYKVVRGMDPDPSGMILWMGVLSQGGSREGIYRAFVMDRFYADRESGQAGEKVGKFSSYFVKKYIGKDFNDELLAQYSFYALKRNITEMALGILDKLRDNPHDFSSWYGVLSGELAQDFPQLFVQMRSNPSMVFHKHWAAQVPQQYVKSETIIKLHQVFEYLNP